MYCICDLIQTKINSNKNQSWSKKKIINHKFFIFHTRVLMIMWEKDKIDTTSCQITVNSVALIKKKKHKYRGDLTIRQLKQ